MNGADITSCAQKPHVTCEVISGLGRALKRAVTDARMSVPREGKARLQTHKDTHIALLHKLRSLEEQSYAAVEPLRVSLRGKIYSDIEKVRTTCGSLTQLCVFGLLYFILFFS